MNQPETLRRRIAKLVATIIGAEVSEVLETGSFEALGLDSLSRIELLVEIEQEFGIQMHDDDPEEGDRQVQETQSLDDAVKLVQGFLSGKSNPDTCEA